MSHNFLFDTYDFIHRRLAAAEQALNQTGADDDARQFAAGQVETLCEFERFLSDHFDIKLPKRMRNQRAESPAVCKRFAASDE